MKRIFIAIILLVVSCGTWAFAGDIDTTTGFGYIVDSNTHIVSKVQLPPGKHPLKAGYTFIELQNKAEMDAIEVYSEPQYDAQSCETALFTAFNNKLSSMMNYYPVISSCLRYGNTTAFTVLKQYCDGLVSAGAVTQGDYNAFKQILSDNQVNLDQYGA